jgi:hypothetical protein
VYNLDHEGIEKMIHYLQANFHVPGLDRWYKTKCGHAMSASATR